MASSGDRRKDPDRDPPASEDDGSCVQGNRFEPVSGNPATAEPPRPPFDRPREPGPEAETGTAQFLLEQAIDSSSNGIIIVAMTAGQPIVHANRGFERLTGYSAAEVLGRNCSFLQGTDTAQDGLKTIRQALAAAQDCYVVLRNYRKNGEMFWNELHLSPVRDADGAVTHYIGIQTDISALQTAEEQRDQLAEQNRLLLESTGDGIIGSDLHGNCTFVNRAAASMLGYEPGELLNKSCHELLHHSHADQRPYPESECPIRQSLQDGIARRIEDETFWHKNGQPVAVTCMVDPIICDAEIKGTVVTFSNNADRRKAAENLRLARQEAEAASQAKSQFLARMSHEIRTPMNTVLGLARLLLDTELTPVQREYLSLLGKSAGDLLDIINDILDLSKIEVGRLDLSLEPFDLPALVGELMQTLEVQAYPKGIRLIFDIAKEVPETVIGDPLRLRQILTNLLGNAIKFTLHGEVLLTIKRYRPKSGHTLLRFSVTDTGIGIPVAQQAHIFDAFHQGERTTNRQSNGTGLGLSITSTLVQLMHGSIKVKSAPGQGSTFSFTAQFGVPSPEALPPREIERFAGQQALVAESNATTRQILCRLLRRVGIRPVAIATGAQALERVQRAARDGHPFTYILLDLHVPDMDGEALASRLSTLINPLQQRIILMHSAGVLPKTSIGRTCIRKPVKTEELYAALSGTPRVLRGTQSIETVRRSFSGCSVLVVEDNLANQKVIKALLMRHDIQVILVDNGQAAIDFLRRSTVDLVFMDIQLPGLDGLETTVQIRKDEAATGRHTPIIALTAHAQQGEAKRCLGAGMDGYLSKPIRIPQLTAILETWLTDPPAAPLTAGPAAGHQGFLDLTYLHSLFNHAPQAISDVLAIYVESMSVLLGKIEDALVAREPERILQYAHQLKGASLNTGAFRVAEACTAVEEVFKTADQTRFSIAITRLTRTASETIEAIRALQPISPAPQSLDAPENAQD